MTMPTTMTFSQLPALLFTSSLQQQVLGTLFVNAVVVTMLLVLPVVLIILAAAWVGSTRLFRGIGAMYCMSSTRVMMASRS
jgi:hypothetical protein